MRPPQRWTISVVKTFNWSTVIKISPYGSIGAGYARNPRNSTASRRPRRGIMRRNSTRAVEDSDDFIVPTEFVKKDPPVLVATFNSFRYPAETNGKFLRRLRHPFQTIFISSFARGFAHFHDLFFHAGLFLQFFVCRPFVPRPLSNTIQTHVSPPRRSFFHRHCSRRTPPPAHVEKSTNYGRSKKGKRRQKFAEQAPSGSPFFARSNRASRHYRPPKIACKRNFVRFI